MSSEESGDDQDNAEFTVSPIRWGNVKVTNFLISLDRKSEKKQSKSNMMSFRRVTGLPSDRSRPEIGC